MTPETSIYEYAKQGLALSADKTALWFYGKGITYRELFRCIDNVADSLYTLGIQQGSVVTLYLPNCPQAVMAVYAVAKLGGICNMVHPLTPIEGLRKNMAFTGSGVLIAGSQCNRIGELDFAEKLIFVDISQFMGKIQGMVFRMKSKPNCPVEAVDFHSLLSPCQENARIPEQTALATECVCYLNSSGTTGVPKTVMHSHMACNNWVYNAKAFFRGSSLKDEVVLSVLPFFHGSGLIMNLHQVLCAGGTQVLLAKWKAKDAVKALRSYKVTVLTGVPFLYQSLLEEKTFKGKVAKRISQCYVSGDSTPIELKKAFNERVGHPVMYEGYGMTETVTACFSTSKYNSRIEASGYPLVNCSAAVMAENGDVRMYGSGELLLCTNTMMLGYLGDSAATEDAFMQIAGKRWFRTRDHGFIDNDGYIYFLERMKDIVIRNGYNIYPREIEMLIRKLTFVKDVTVIGKKSSGAKGEEVYVFIVITEEKGKEVAKKEVMDVCIAELPGFAIPDGIVFVEKIPRNNLNKVDKNKLVDLV